VPCRSPEVLGITRLHRVAGRTGARTGSGPAHFVRRLDELPKCRGQVLEVFGRLRMCRVSDVKRLPDGKQVPVGYIPFMPFPKGARLLIGTRQCAYVNEFAGHTFQVDMPNKVTRSPLNRFCCGWPGTARPGDRVRGTRGSDDAYACEAGAAVKAASMNAVFAPV
jgi:hypothetical protein